MSAAPSDHAADLSIPVFTHQQIIRVITGILLCIFLAAIDQTVVIPAVPAIAADLNGFGHLSWIVSAYLLTSTAATPIYGKLSDLFGRRALLLPGLAVFIIASILCAMSQNLGQLIAARALQGIGGGGLMSMAQAAIADVVSPRERGRYQGYMASVWGIASIAGPIVGGWVTDHLTWRWIFWANVPVGLLAMYLCDRALRLLHTQGKRSRIDWTGAGLLTGAITAFLLVLSWGGVEMPWLSAPIVGLLALGVVLILLLAVQERRVDDPLLPPRLFRNAVFVRGVGVAFLGSLGLFGATFLLPLFFQLVRGVDAAASGILVVPFLGTNSLGAFVAGQLARRLGRTKGILIAGLSVCAVSFALLATMRADTSHYLSVAYMLFLGLGLGMTMPSCLVAVQNAAERRDVGVATGTLLFLRSMGGAFGTTLVGALLTARFTTMLEAAGVKTRIDLGAVRGPDGGLGNLAPAARLAAQAGLESGFHFAFLACAAALLIAVLLTLGMRDLPLRSVSAAAPLSH